MCSSNADEFDSQILGENVKFLEDCFDNSFNLQNSILIAKEFIAETDYEPKKRKKADRTCLSKTLSLEASICKTQLTIPTLDLVNSKPLSAWGLPHEISLKYEMRGIKQMFEWQVSCLGNSKVLLDCCNLVYSAPTSAGKTLVAEILTIKTVLERQKKVIIILPFVSIVREKMFYLQDILSSSGVRVEGFMGSQSPPGGLQAVHVAICTIEKANSLVNRLLEDGYISELGAVVVDELHLLGDPHRGYILELLLAKLKYVSSKLDNQIQIVGMSATLPNLEILAKWLDAELFVTQFRPIPLEEFCLVDKKLFDKSGNHIRTKEVCDNVLFTDSLLKICFDTIKDGCSTLIFCMTKSRCESLAQSISSSFYKLGCANNEAGEVLRKQLNAQNISEVLEQLKNCPVGLDSVLKNTISFAVAYHHAGLTFDERDIIEGAFKSGAIRVLVATSTLSSGVNLPARKVIIRSPVFQRQPINILTYKQMIGRAGRMGRDTKGESILVCTEAEKKIGFNLMMGALEPVKSCIESKDKFMRALLEMIASEMANTVEELNSYCECTLLFTEQDPCIDQKSLLSSTLDELKNYELIRLQNIEEKTKFVATSLGKACLSSSMSPNDGLSLFCELQRARQCLVLETDLHLIYLVTPYSVSSQWGDIDWLHLLSMWESLTKANKRVSDLIGVQESFMIRCVRSTKHSATAHNKINIHKRFYTALALQDLVNEVPLSDVAAKFQCARGFLQSLQQAAATFAGMVTVFCHQLGWKNLEMLISQFQDRLQFGIQSELIELMKLSTLNGLRARSLFDSGFETIASIASADINSIENTLLKALPFQSEKQRDDDDTTDLKKRNKMRNIWITGCCGITTKEAAENLVAEARKYLELEIGTDIKWDKEKNNMNEKDPKDTVQSQSVKRLSDSTNITCKEECLKTCVSQKMCQDEATKINIEDRVIISQENYDEPTIMENSSRPMIETRLHDDLKLETNDETSKNICSFQDEHIKICKESLAWESLNLEETIFKSVVNSRTSDNVFSPEISFSDEAKSARKNQSTLETGTRDVSLFSSDGDNSLFEDSLPIELIPSKIFDNQVSQNYLSKNDIDRFKNGADSVKNIIDEEEDFKLVYEDDSKPIDNNLKINTETQDFVVNSQNLYDLETNSFTNVCKRRIDENTKKIDEPSLKKVKTQPTIDYLTEKPNSGIVLTSRSNQSKIEDKECTLNCYILNEKDLQANMPYIRRFSNASLCLNINNLKPASTETIGSNLFSRDVHKVISTSHNVIKGIAVYNGQNDVIYVETDSNMTEIKNWLAGADLALKLKSSKYTHLYLKTYLGITLSASCFDICIADWLVNSNEKEPSIIDLTKKYCDIDISAIAVKNHVEETCLKTWAIWKVAEKQEVSILDKYPGIRSIFDIEMKISTILAECEFYGLTVDKKLTSQFLIDVKGTLETVAKRAHKLCGYHLNFNSSKDVAKAIGIYKGKKTSTKKAVLAAHNSEISSLVIYWRKLNSILTKTLYPLTERAVNYSVDNKITSTYTMFTCSGRVSMHEPNLQNVPRTFSIPLRHLQDGGCDDVIEFNCRRVFRASPGHVLVSADYCQLEMRILTHYCADDTLVAIMRSDVDVFRSIAASWGGVPEEEVDDDLRQKAKQLCYGIIYGMGARALSHALDASEPDAAAFMDAFHRTYPAIRRFTDSVVEDCRRKGYIETLMKRRRYLPDIGSKVLAKKSAAERQAVNTTIQGSAADIAKAAMCAVHTRHAHTRSPPRLILQMHDELIYEVPDSRRHAFASTLKRLMENAVRLSVPLPVKVRSGSDWGSLAEI